MSRRAFVPTDHDRKTVRAMAAYGIPQADIARVIGCDPKTLRQYFRDDLDKAMIEANAQVIGTLFSIATDRKHPGVTTSAIFWAKTRMGWREKEANDGAGTIVVVRGGLPENVDSAKATPSKKRNADRS